MNILEEANDVVSGSRTETYGHPSDNLEKLRPLWEGILGINISDDQIAFCMVALKMARHLTNPARDNLVDMAGWSRVAEMCHQRNFPGSWASE
jgi:Domain of unknown function (DUF6378)